MFKQVMAAMMLLFMLATSVFAASATIMNATAAKPYTQVMTHTFTNDSTTTGAGAGTTYTLGVPMSNFTCSSILSGLTPTTQTTALQGSVDGTNWFVMSSSTATVSAIINSTGQMATSIRMNQTIHTSGTGTGVTTTRCYGAQ